MAAAHHVTNNYLLSALPMNDLQRITPHLELVSMQSGDYYCESGSKMEYVYFPTTSIVSLTSVMENGAVYEIASVGNEGMLGISLFMDGNSTPCVPFVRCSGYGFRMKARLLMDEFNRAGFMERLLLRYTHALIAQTSCTALCNHDHSIEQRLCRWILLSLDRIPSNDLPFAREFVPALFSVEREAVLDAINKLQQAKVLVHHIDHISVLNWHGLEERVCACYGEIKREFDRLRGLDFDWRPMPESARTWSRAGSSICAMM